MKKIKGTIRIGKGGKSAADFIREGNIKLPFSATGWKSTLNSDLVTGKKPSIKLKAPIEEPVAVIEEPIPVIEEEIEELIEENVVEETIKKIHKKKK